MQKICTKSAWNKHESMTLYVIAYFAYISSCILHFPDDATEQCQGNIFSCYFLVRHIPGSKMATILYILASTFRHCFKKYWLNVWLMSKLSMSLVTFSWVGMLVWRFVPVCFTPATAAQEYYFSSKDENTSKWRCRLVKWPMLASQRPICLLFFYFFGLSNNT